MEYRAESFIEFIKKVRIKYLLILNLGFIAMLVAFYFSESDEIPNEFSALYVFIFFLFVIINGFVYGVHFTVYKKGRKVFLELQNTNKELVENIKLSIPKFDYFSMANKFSSGFSKTSYDFKEADLIITAHSIIVLGKENSYSTSLFAIPIELTNEKNVTSLTSAWISYWKEKSNSILLEINDPNFEKSIQLEFKSDLDKIKKWLQSNKRIKQA